GPAWRGPGPAGCEPGPAGWAPGPALPLATLGAPTFAALEPAFGPADPPPLSFAGSAPPGPPPAGPAPLTGRVLVTFCSAPPPGVPVGRVAEVLAAPVAPLAATPAAELVPAGPVTALAPTIPWPLNWPALDVAAIAGWPL